MTRKRVTDKWQMGWKSFVDLKKPFIDGVTLSRR